jgi:hypothetical protein
MITAISRWGLTLDGQEASDLHAAQIDQRNPDVNHRRPLSTMFGVNEVLVAHLKVFGGLIAVRAAAGS